MITYKAEDVAWFNSQVAYVPTNKQLMGRRLSDAIEQVNLSGPLEKAYEQTMDAERKMSAYWQSRYSQEYVMRTTIQKDARILQTRYKFWRVIGWTLLSVLGVCVVVGLVMWGAK